MSKEPDNELREKLAAIEHERWSDWQKWCNEVIRKTIKDGNELELVLARWDRQIDTPYDNLTPGEQMSDMHQVDRYWPLIDAHVKVKVKEAEISEAITQLEWTKKNYTRPDFLEDIDFLINSYRKDLAEYTNPK